VRSTNIPSSPTLAQSLLLPPDYAAYKQAKQNGHNNARQWIEGWSQFTGRHSVWFARNLDEAYHLLLQTLEIVNGEPVLMPPNATHPLVEAVMKSGAKPLFGELDQNLKLSGPRQTRITWLQAPLGLSIENDADSQITVMDCSDSVPRGAAAAGKSSYQADVTIFGLHLSPDAEASGILLVFNSETLYSRMLARNKSIDPAICAQAAIQLKRLQFITSHQAAALEVVLTGLRQAAGLPGLSPTDGVALAHGVAIRIPDEGSPSTFWTYCKSENTPVEWLPQIRPVHYAAIASRPNTAKNLEQWFIVPVSPENDEEANKQAVLGVVKTAEYLGLRWFTDPERATQYADLLNAMYGSNHDAYRPVFTIGDRLPAELIFDAGEVLGPSCSI
jgi:dTDP-4-amino-4,6-dideoxygalactose transaminase